MAIGTIVVSAVAAVYAVFHRKINSLAKGVAAGVRELVKIATRGYREKRKEKKSEK